MKLLTFILISISILFSCTQTNRTHHKSNESVRYDTVGQFVYYVKDTTSTILISYHECTECLDAWVDSGVVYLTDSIVRKIKNLYNERGGGFIPNGHDLYLVGEDKIAEKLFGDSMNYGELWGNKYLVKGKAIGTKSYAIIFRVDSYKIYKEGNDK